MASSRESHRIAQTTDSRIGSAQEEDWFHRALATRDTASEVTKDYYADAESPNKSELQSLSERVSSLEETVEDLRKRLPIEEVVEIREINDLEARSEILAAIEASDHDLFYSDLADSLRLDLRQVVRVCDLLVVEEKLNYGA